MCMVDQVSRLHNCDEQREKRHLFAGNYNNYNKN